MPRFEPLPERRPAIIAGASSGIGEATAIELASRGFPVALGARRVEKITELVGKIQADGGEAVGFHLDVTDPNSVKSFVSQSVDALGDIEVLVAGAGDTYFGKLADISTDECDSQLQINLVGENRLCAALVPTMLAGWPRPSCRVRSCCASSPSSSSAPTSRFGSARTWARTERPRQPS